MPLTKQKKEEILTTLKSNLKESSVVLFINFHGLTTSLSGELRAILRKIGAKYLVAKKTLIRKSLEEINPGGVSPELDGEVAMVFGKDDVVLPAKSLVTFSKAHEEVTVLGGIMENVFMARDSVLRLASLPSREVLLGQLLGVINSPRRGMVVTLSGVMRNFVSVLNQIKK